MGVTLDAVSAVNRFGMGAKPGELSALGEPRESLKAQIARGANGTDAFSGLHDSLDYLREEATLRATRREFKQADRSRLEQPASASAAANAAVAGRNNVLRDTPTNGNGNGNGNGNASVTASAAALKKALQPYRRTAREQFLAEAAARLNVATFTDTPFIERLVHFWSNHFAVSVDKRSARMYASPMEREAIRPHFIGRFVDMLVAVESHPAMLLYLDNVRSIGPDSPLGKRIASRLARRGKQDEGKAGGLNENLGREAMELHTVGVNGGYTQADVTEFSRALTGWSIPFSRDFASGQRPRSAFVFRDSAHEPGSRQVMGKTFAEDGVAQGQAILEFLARQPATAKHLSLKLARHFVADDPPATLVDRMAKSYLDHDTDLAAVYRTLVASPEAWGSDARKFKTPQDFVISALRAAQIRVDDKPQAVLALLLNLGMPMFEPRSPAGFSDDSANWLDADGLWKRVQTAQAMAARIARDDGQPLALAQDILGPTLDKDTSDAIARAESTQQACATIFASPAFQWRV